MIQHHKLISFCRNFWRYLLRKVTTVRQHYIHKTEQYALVPFFCFLLQNGLYSTIESIAKFGHFIRNPVEMNNTVQKTLLIFTVI